MTEPTADAWGASRPASTHDLARRFPQGAVYLVAGVPHHLLGYREAHDGRHQLILTPVDPTVDYDAAMAAHVSLPAHYFRGWIVEADAPRRIMFHDPAAD